MTTLNGDSLPHGWAMAPLCDIADTNPRGPDRLPNDDDLVSFVPMAAVEAMSGRLDSHDLREWKTVKKGFTRFQEGDVLFAKITPCMENGKVALARHLHRGIGAGSTEFHVLRPTRAAEAKFLMYYVLQEQFRKDARAKMTGTAGQLRVPASFLEERVLALPPVSEQQRIVGAIESYLTKLDAAVAALDRARANLKRYRASVLKAAVEGRLVPTEAELARKEGREFEPASMLLDRTFAERRHRWEESELARTRAAGKPPKDDRWKSKYKEPVVPNATALPPLPEGWCWATIEQISILVTDGDHNPPKRISDGVPHLTAKNIKNLQIYLEGCSYISRNDASRVFRRYHPEPGDLVVTCVGTVGRTAIVPDTFEFSPDRNLAAIRFCNTGPSAAYVQYFLEAPHTQAALMSASGSTAQPHLYLGDLRRLPIALPPAAEQLRIIAEVDSIISVAEKSERTIETSLRRCTRLRQSILKRAFEGKLVDQDPNDEPASILLERIRAERAAAPPSRKSSNSKTHETEAAK